MNGLYYTCDLRPRVDALRNQGIGGIGEFGIIVMVVVGFRASGTPGRDFSGFKPPFSVEVLCLHTFGCMCWRLREWYTAYAGKSMVPWGAA